MPANECEKGTVFDVGEEITCSGLYVCVPCGYKKEFVEGNILPRCFDCIDKEDNPDNLTKDLGLWELIEAKK
ncbi:MAG: hypothetical protein WD061_03720 [Candidatus Saccharimonadales bacterium]